MSNTYPGLFDENILPKLREDGYSLEDLLKEGQGNAFAEDSIKSRFVQSLMDIMKDAEKRKKEASEFVKHFGKMFTLNYDVFLYKVAIYAKQADKKRTQKKENSEVEEIRRIIEALRSISFPNHKNFDDFSETDKINLIAAIGIDGVKKISVKSAAKAYFQNERLRLNSEEGESNSWELNDGFLSANGGFEWNKHSKQNLFYLHGSLHIYNDGRTIKRTTTTGGSTLREEIYKRLATPNAIDFVFKSTSEEKLKSINNNKYRKYSLEQLKEISGVLFIYGLAFANNDEHIWKVINENNKLKKIHVSIYTGQEENELEEYTKRVKHMLQNHKAKIIFFDSKSITQ